jgi:hypothetical protein
MSNPVVFVVGQLPEVTQPMTMMRFYCQPHRFYGGIERWMTAQGAKPNLI